MKKTILFYLSLVLILAGQNVFAQQDNDKDSGKLMTWNNALSQKPPFYKTDEAVRIADQLLLFQKNNGGWGKNTDMAKILTDAERDKIIKEKSDIGESTIDNKSTYTQLEYLAKLMTANAQKSPPLTNQEKYLEAFFKGFDYLISSQYTNGGFPQFYPLRKGYYTHITYNDGAMIGALNLLKDIAEKKSDYFFIDEERRQKAENAVKKGIDAILKTQVKVNGVKTVWCAQHDEVTLEPASARNYEIISLSGAESVGIVQFLMSIEKPSTDVTDAVKSAIKWFEESKITGIKLEDKPFQGAPKGFDRIVVEDKNAPPLWARFYDIQTNRPIFAGRDKVVKYSLAEIEIERRTGYNYYTNAPQKLIEVDYPKWLSKNK